MAVTGHQYRLLQNDEIRLLKVLVPESTLCGSLIHGSLSHVPLPYVALSHRWTKLLDSEIQLDGHRKQISRTLAKVLSRLRDAGRDVVWVDTLCINQQDNVEKSAQIWRMETIYRKADWVAVWLGEEAHGSGKVMSFLRRIPANVEQSGSIKGILREGSSPSPEELGRFFSRSYWSRTWIVQEVSVGKEVQLMCGDEVAPWRSLKLLVEYLLAQRPDHPKLEIISNVLGIRNQRLTRVPSGLLELLGGLRRSDASERKDRVYGILSLSSDGRDFVPTPSYSVTDTELCISMFRTFIQSTGDMDLIFLGIHGSANNQELPSWCPNFLNVDYEAFNSRAVAYFSGHDVRYRYGRQCGRWSATRESRLQPQSFLFDGKILNVLGGKIGTINGLGRVRQDPPSASWPQSYSGSPSSVHPDASPALARSLLLYCMRYIAFAFKPTAQQLLYPVAGLVWTWGVDRFTRTESPLRVWADNNKEMSIFGKSLRSWCTIYSGVGHYRHEAKRFYSGLIDRDVRSPNPFNRGEILKAMQEVVEEDLRLTTLEEGHLGWAHPDARLGDHIFLLSGCSMPVVLRSMPDTDTYTVVGHSYIDGAMNGEVWERYGESDLIPVHLC
jgi:hypothetical protein